MNAAAGWHPDPYGRFEHRYWDGTGWTSLVAAQGATAQDPVGTIPTPPASPASPTPAGDQWWVDGDRAAPSVGLAPPASAGPPTATFTSPPAATFTSPAAPSFASPAAPSFASPAAPSFASPAIGVEAPGFPTPTGPTGPAGPTASTFVFDGGVGECFGIWLGTGLLQIVTLGFATPWAFVIRKRWITAHTTVDGRRLRFTGTGGQLFWRWLGWMLLSVVTLGIYFSWAVVNLERWTLERTEHADQGGGSTAPGPVLRFTGTGGGNLVSSLVAVALTIVTLGLGFSWAVVRRIRWFTSNTELHGRPLRFGPSGGQYLWLAIRIIFLSLITLGIYTFWARVRLIKWRIEGQLV